MKGNEKTAISERTVERSLGISKYQPSAIMVTLAVMADIA